MVFPGIGCDGIPGNGGMPPAASAPGNPPPIICCNIFIMGSSSPGAPPCPAAPKPSMPGKPAKGFANGFVPVGGVPLPLAGSRPSMSWRRASSFIIGGWLASILAEGMRFVVLGG